MGQKSASAAAAVDYEFLSLAKPQPGNPNSVDDVIHRLRVALEREDEDGFSESPTNLFRKMNSEELNALLKDLEWGLRGVSSTSYQRFKDMLGGETVATTTNSMLTRAASQVSRGSLRSRDSQRSQMSLASQRSLHKSTSR